MILLCELTSLKDLKELTFYGSCICSVASLADPTQHRPQRYQAVLLCFNQWGRLLFSIFSAGGLEAGKKDCQHMRANTVMDFCFIDSLWGICSDGVESHAVVSTADLLIMTISSSALADVDEGRTGRAD